MIQAWLVVAPNSKLYTVSTVLFNKDVGANVTVKNCMSHFYMFVPTKATVELASGNTGYAQGIGIILCSFTNCSIKYPVVPVYYCPGHPSNTISLGALKFYVGFKKVKPEILEHCEFINPQGCYWKYSYQTQNNLGYLQINICQIKSSNIQE